MARSKSSICLGDCNLINASGTPTPRLSGAFTRAENQSLSLQTPRAVSGTCIQDCFIFPKTGGNVYSSAVAFELADLLGQVSWLWVRVL